MVVEALSIVVASGSVKYGPLMYSPLVVDARRFSER